ncbi:hypothetical protein CR51_07420 [Caballeronia megalochromosomata]|nr:hypothetical protein CR51_07420 [Caballeronia megalochromosomata]
MVRAGVDARILIVGQASGARVHASGILWDDASGDRTPIRERARKVGTALQTLARLSGTLMQLARAKGGRVLQIHLKTCGRFFKSSSKASRAPSELM